MSDKTLAVSEAFFSIQGEGSTMGRPSYFIRLTSCNLECGLTKESISKARKEQWSQEKIIENKMPQASWVCDSTAVWVKGKHKTFEELITMLGGQTFLKNLKNKARLIFTGGEPLLQQFEIIGFTGYLKDLYNISPIVEVETNGTIVPINELIALVNHWNVSPKLSNSGMQYQDRVKDDAMMILSSLSTSIFKFVIKSKEDFLEIVTDYLSRFNISSDKIYLMPAADNRADLIKISADVAEICIANNLNFSSRIHLVNWDQKTGV